MPAVAQSPWAWWDLGVAAKHAGRWSECLAACERSIALGVEGPEGAYWNIGIAATALGDWAKARAAWRAVGVEVSDGEGPLEMGLGSVPIRINPTGEAEVVWTHRLDPCRARIVSVPFPDSGRRYGDLVLHDGERRGERKLGQQVVPVFDELALLEQSEYGTWRIDVEIADREERDRLVAELEQTARAVEDWTESVRPLCAACSLGSAHEHEEEPAQDEWEPVRRIAVAARTEDDLRPLRRLRVFWRKGVRSVARVL